MIYIRYFLICLIECGECKQEFQLHEIKFCNDCIYHLCEECDLNYHLAHGIDHHFRENLGSK